MNIFRLDDCPNMAAIYYQDIHVRKIIVESAQLLANCYDLQILTLAPKTQSGNWRKHSHVHHPISKWTKYNINNFDWVLSHAKALCAEFQHRFDKKHFCEDFIKWCSQNNPSLPNTPGTEQPQCFLKHPDCMVNKNPVLGYRNYYNKCKLSFAFRGQKKYATWTKREIPFFIKAEKFLDSNSK